LDVWTQCRSISGWSGTWRFAAIIHGKQTCIFCGETLIEDWINCITRPAIRTSIDDNVWGAVPGERRRKRMTIPSCKWCKSCYGCNSCKRKSFVTILTVAVNYFKSTRRNYHCRKGPLCWKADVIGEVVTCKIYGQSACIINLNPVAKFIVFVGKNRIVFVAAFVDNDLRKCLARKAQRENKYCNWIFQDDEIVLPNVQKML